MKTSAAERAVAIVGVGAILPDAPNAQKFWQNIREGVDSIKEVPRDRWNPDLYYDANPKVPDKTYCKIGGWVCDWEWDPLKWKFPIPPRVSQLMDLTQKWGIATAREALADYGWPARPLDRERTAVIYGNAMGGDMHLYSAARVFFPEFTEELKKASGFASLPPDVRKSIIEQMYEGIDGKLPQITEDTMPGELSNILAGRIAAIFDFNGPNFVSDAACASAMAGMTAAVSGLVDGDYDAVLTGGIDANMSPSTFVKFSKIGALSPTGSRPYAAGADGFIMGEGGVTFILKRLTDAERDGDKIYAVIRSIGGSSDGKGKGITAPNPNGQKLCVRRAWEKAGVRPAPGILIEGHGTSTPVGDAAELEALSESFQEFGLPAASIALGSVKSNIGHLKGGAGAAGILKAVFALHEKLLPPSLNFNAPNPNVDFTSIPFYVNTKLRQWDIAPGEARRAAVSAFGFGGTNFHTVLEEYIPGRIASELRTTISVPEMISPATVSDANLKAPLRGALVVGAASAAELKTKLEAALKDAEAGNAPAPSAPRETDLRADMRVAIDYGDAAELADKLPRAIKALQEDQASRWKALRPKGIFFGKGPAPKVAFLFPGQGSQYVNMIQELRRTEPIVAEVFEQADRVMTPLLGKPLTSCIYLDKSDEAALLEAEDGLKQTAITQPAVLATETALARLLGAYGIKPDMVMGHSLGEYGALVAAGAITFENALKAVSARGQEMTKCAMDDNGLMAAAAGPIAEIQKVLDGISEYVVIANINSTKEAVIGGSSAGVEKAVEALKAAGFRAQLLQVSHAFHTNIVAASGEALKQVLEKMDIQPAAIPIITNVTGEFYPTGSGVVPEMINLLGRQVSSPVQFIKGLNTLYDAGIRVFIEMGPKRVLYGFVDDVLGSREGVAALFTNHPRIGEAASVNQALCGLYAAGLGAAASLPLSGQSTVNNERETTRLAAAPAAPVFVQRPPAHANFGGDRYAELGKLFTEFMDKSFQVYSRGSAAAAPADICITGAALGLPGVEGVFQDSNVESILRGDSYINPAPLNLRKEMVEKNIVRLVKSENGEGRFDTIGSIADVIKLAARAKDFDIERDFGFPKERMAALDRVTRLAIGAGIDAMRDAGIPLVMRYKTTTKGTQLPDRWQLPEEMRDDTGILFTSAFPGYDFYAQFLTDFHNDKARRERLKELESLRALASGAAANEIDRRIAELKIEIDEKAYQFDRRFLFQVLSMGHSQFAEYIGARGPNTATNAACSSGTQAVALASDWIRAGRCRRVIVISADDITSDNLFGWFGSGFLASGSAATGEIVAEEATPFDRRRHGLIIGMGASSVVIESAEAARERGIRPICRLLGSVTANSAFHGTRLDVGHISEVMEKLISGAEKDWGINRYEIAPETVFVSHETYTPARGGSASAEIFALRHVFGDTIDRIVIANTKGATGHPMGVGIEDAVSIKILETGIVPPVPNFREVDPELGNLNLSKGGSYPVRYVLRLAAGFGSQISMTLLEWIPGTDGRRPAPSALGYAYRVEDTAAWNAWLKRATGYAAPEIEVERRTLRVKDQWPTGFSDTKPYIQGITPSAPSVSKTAAPKMEARLISEPVAKPTMTVAAPPARPVTDEVQTRVMRIIAEKTGYPTDMLDMDLDLEADLGIDTVKQAEMFAAIREAYDIPRDENLKMRDFPTLAHVVQFVYDRRPDLATIKETVPVVAAAAPAVSPASSMSPVQAEDAVKEKVIEIIAEKTGYPTDMLDPDLDLEADLGVDTVKQAEMFAAIREAYEIPRDENLKMRDFPTLAHVVQFVYDRRPDLAAIKETATAVAAAAPAVSPKSPMSPVQAVDAVKEKVIEIIAEKTGYPTDMLDPDLDLEADLGVDTVKQAEMFAAIREAYDIPRDENLKMRDFPTLAHVVQFVYDRRPDLAAIKETVPVAAAAAPAVSPVTSMSPVQAEDAVKEKVIEIIAEKTGYPPDMLDPDLDLEADLGVDTVKQAEMFAAIRDVYDIPRDENLKMRDFPTLAHVVQFVYDRRPDLATAATVKEIANATAASAMSPLSTTPADDALKSPTAPDPVKGSMEAADAIARRVPVPRLRPSLNLCKATGVSLGNGSRVVVMPDKGGAGKEIIGKLEKAGVETLVIEGDLTTEAFEKTLADWKAAGPIQGVYWLAALDKAKAVADMTYDEWREVLRRRAKLLFTAMRVCYDQIGQPGTFLVSATRLGGQHGYDAAGAYDPLGGAVTGLTKAMKREKPDMTVKAVDFEAEHSSDQIAELLIKETCLDPGAVEIGYKEGRWTIGFEERAIVAPSAVQLSNDSVFVVTGAAGSIVSAITADITVAAGGGTFYLLDLAPEPDAENPDIARLNTDMEGLKREIFARLKEKGERATPVIVEKEIAALERAQAALAAIQAIRSAGGTAHYYSLNLCDNAAVTEVMKIVSERHGRVDALIHAAGLEISRIVPDKNPSEFDLVFDVKSDGWFNLLSGLGETPIGAAVAFSSVAGRFGNAGQTDYSAANDLLCKCVSNFRTSRPDTRGIAIDWTAWSGIGMAARGSIPAIMKQAGIDMLAPEAGIPITRRELLAGTGAELVIGGKLGIMVKDFDAEGGLSTEAAKAGGVMTGKVKGLSLYDGLTVETELDPEKQPFLYDHQIDGVPVLPGVMGIEAMVEAACLLFPDMYAAAIEDVNFLAPFKFYRNQPRVVTVQAVYTTEGADGADILADCRLTGSRLLHGQDEAEVTTHFTGRVRLTEKAPKEVKYDEPFTFDDAEKAADSDIYKIYFHGPAYRVINSAWRDGNRIVARFAENLPPNHEPEDRQLLAAPRLAELCFQAAGLIGITENSRLGLPGGLKEMNVIAQPKGLVYAIVSAGSGDSADLYDITIVDEKGKVCMTIGGYRTIALTSAVSEDHVAPLKRALARS